METHTSRREGSVSPLGITDYFTLGDSILLGWITLDILANILLVKREKGVHFRFFRALYTKRSKAVVAAFAQFLLALVASFFIYDLWAFIISFEVNYLVPITLTTGAILYLYILLGLPYKIRTLKRLGPPIAVLLIALLLALLIYLLSGGAF